MKYENLGNAILVPIVQNYSILAFIKNDKVKDKHTITFYLHRKDIPTYDLIEEVEDLSLPNIEKNSIKTYVCNFIEDCFKNGMFNKYIIRFEYQQKCFDIGVELLNSQERGADE